MLPLSNLALAHPSFHVLLGGDVYVSIMDGQKIVVDKTLSVAFSFIFGWIIIVLVPQRVVPPP